MLRGLFLIKLHAFSVHLVTLLKRSTQVLFCEFYEEAPDNKYMNEFFEAKIYK